MLKLAVGSQPTAKKQTSINALAARAGLVLLLIMAVAGGAGLYTSFELGGKLKSSNIAGEVLSASHQEF